MPEKPIKAKANSPAVMRAMGIPRIALGTSLKVSCSRIPAKMVRARVNPMAVDTAYTTDSTRLKSFCITKIATPSMAQLVVMSGKNTPNA